MVRIVLGYYHRGRTNAQLWPLWMVARALAGIVREFDVTETATLGVRRAVFFHMIPSRLQSRYGSNSPAGSAVFLRLKVE